MPEKYELESYKFNLGGIVLSIIPDLSARQFEIAKPGYDLFRTQETPDIVLRAQYKPSFDLELGDPIFDSAGNWSLNRTSNKIIIVIKTPEFNPYQIVVLDSDLQKGEIYCIGELWNFRERRPPILGYPLAEVLMVNLLSRSRGILMHACAVTDGNVGLLFSGSSGSGKSTTSKLWNGRDGISILSDDRVIIRKFGNNFSMFGTPWHGDANAALPGSAPIEMVFILKHANKNSAEILEPLDAAARLLVRTVPTFWDAQGMDFTLKFLAELVETVPCYELNFVPDSSSVEYVKSLSVNLVVQH